ncbi:MAG TPA: hypothetical protein VGK61_05245, partial [Planctomycetota bacterium]
FIWRNKGAVFGTAVLAAFLADPAPYLDGIKRLVVEPAAQTAAEVAKRTNWTLVVLAVLAAGAGVVWVRSGGVAKLIRRS